MTAQRLISFECGNPNARETPATPVQSGAKDTVDSAFFQATRSRTMAAVKVATAGDFVQWSSCAAWCVKQTWAILSQDLLGRRDTKRGVTWSISVCRSRLGDVMRPFPLSCRISKVLMAGQPSVAFPADMVFLNLHNLQVACTTWRVLNNWILSLLS